MVNNLKGKKVLVTGADGFIGSHLTEILVKQNAKVTALSCYNSFNYWGWLEDVDCLDSIDIKSGDIRDPFFCQKLTKNIDVILTPRFILFLKEICTIGLKIKIIILNLI